MPLTDPFALRLSEAHMEFLDEVRERRSFATRAAVVRALIEDARIREQRRRRRQPIAPSTY
jgi:Arc/MetJ-type ribon-helix-helix transcriptional regulator